MKLLLQDSDGRSRVAAGFIRLTPVVTWLLRSPAHRLLRFRGALLRYQGRRSGRWYETPVARHRGDAVVIALSERRGRNWWRNDRTT